MEHIYLDYAATTPTDPEVIKAMEPYFFDRFGNASSPHTIGQQALKALEDARASLAQFIGASASEVIFNSGASEGNNHVLFGLARAQKDKGKHIILSNIEHHSVLEPVEAMENEGYRVTTIGCDPEGRIDPALVQKAINADTILIAVIHASNEIGSIQPITTIGKIAREKKIPFLVDATQTVGHIPVNVNELGADLLTFSAHKFYGPKGMGALYMREGTRLTSFLLGGDQERNRRASTQNIAGAVGMAKAAQLCAQRMQEESKVQSALRDRLINEVTRRIDGVKMNGHRTERLPNNAHFSFEGVEGESLLMSLDMAHIAASMGSACTSGAMEPSHVLRAIGLSDELAYGSLRITIGRWTTPAHIDYLLEKLPSIVESLRM